MKKISTLIIGLTAVFALTACGGSKGKEVKQEEFQKQAAEVKEPETAYKSATVNWSYSIKSSGNGNDVNQSDKGEYVFTPGEYGWTTESAVADSYASQMLVLVGTNVKELIAEEYDFSAMATLFGGSENDVTVKFYTGPLGIEAKINLNMSESGMSMKIKGGSYMGFNDYGYITKYETKIDMSAKMSAGGESISASGKATLSFSVSYK